LLSILEVASVAKDSRGIAGASRGVLKEIDARLSQVDEQLAAHDELLAERDRLRRARATLTGESSSARISSDEVAAYLAEHPGAKPGEIARALGVASGTVSAHLFRGKRAHFVSRGGSWYLRQAPSERKAR
jgi:DNA-directed RNA polymerase specialized sigma24 family protein